MTFHRRMSLAPGPFVALVLLGLGACQPKIQRAPAGEFSPSPAQSDPSLASVPPGPTLRPIGTVKSGWYGPGFAGRKTANGEVFDPGELTAAHRTLPFGTLVQVTEPTTQRSVVVRVNDRGPFVASRGIDLSEAAAGRIGLIDVGVAAVELAVLISE